MSERDTPEITDEDVMALYLAWDEEPGTTHASLIRAAYARGIEAARSTLKHGEALEKIIRTIDSTFAWMDSEGLGGEAVCWIEESHLNELIAGTEAWNPAHAREFSGAVALFRSPSVEPSPAKHGEAAGWQPIETAPKDMGARLLLVGDCCVQGFIDATGRWCVQDDRSAWRMMRGRPTHWAPLFAAPREPKP